MSSTVAGLIPGSTFGLTSGSPAGSDFGSAFGSPSGKISGATAGQDETAPRVSLARVSAELSDSVGRVPLGLLTDREITIITREAEELGRHVDALRVQLAGEIEARAHIDFGQGSLAAQHGCRNATELLQRITRASATTAAKRFALARQTRAELGFSGHIIPAKFPAVAAALAAHTINCESAEIITRALGNLPGQVDHDDLAHAEQCLVAASCGTAPPDGSPALTAEHADNIRVMSKAWAAALDQDGPTPDFDEQQQQRYLRFGVERQGLVPVRGSVMPEVAALIARMIDAINSPRTGGGAAGGGAAGGGEESKATVPGAAASRVRFFAAGTAEQGGGAEQSSVTNFDDPADLGDVTDASRHATTGGLGDDLALSDRRTPGQKRHDAFAAIAQAASQQTSMPSLGGAAVTVLIQVDAEQLLERRGTGWLHGHDGAATPISIAGVEHAACSGTAHRVAQNPDGRIIELGGPQRVFNAHQRRVIALRDGGCVIPGCTVPATWCEIHHVTEYAHGGKTHTDNGVTACWYHHRSLGTNGWEIRMSDGTPEVLAPPWIDPSQTWRPTRPPMRPPGLEAQRRRSGLEAQRQRTDKRQHTSPGERG